MKKIIVGLLVILVGVFGFIAVDGANAAPAEAAGVGPYNGIFHGTVYAPDGSSAPMSLNMTHQGNVVDGTIFIGEGLHLEAGVCGAVNIPAYSLNATGRTSPTNPRSLTATSAFDVSGIDVTVTLNSHITGSNLNAEATIDLPWLCGGDQVLTGTFHKA